MPLACYILGIMMIDTLIEQLIKLRRTYGCIEVDLEADDCFQATHSDVGIRIDEFGDVLAVIQSVYNKKKKGFNQLMQNDSWLQFKGPNVGDNEAKRLWAEAGKPSRMTSREIVEASPEDKPLMSYLVIFGRDPMGMETQRFTTSEYLESTNTGVDLLKEINNLRTSILFKIDNVICLGQVDIKETK